jgi:opacity protein-like surface antigen
MPNLKYRTLALAAVAAGAVAIAASTAAPAVAASTGDTGTATITEPGSAVVSLAKAGLVLLPGGPDTSTYGAGHDVITAPVSGGNGNVSILHGKLDLGGSLTYIDGATHRSVTLGKLAFSYDTGNITAVAGKKHLTLAGIAGAMTETITPGAVTGTETQQFRAGQLLLTSGTAKYLDTALKTRHFKSGASFGPFEATYTFTTPAS